MMELVGPNSRRPVRPAVAKRILDQINEFEARLLDRKSGSLRIAAASVVVAIDKARDSYRCRDARKELLALREDAVTAINDRYNQSVAFQGTEAEITDLYIHLQQNLLKG